jgi:hypothetical protein
VDVASVPGYTIKELVLPRAGARVSNFCKYTQYIGITKGQGESVLYWAQILQVLLSDYATATKNTAEEEVKSSLNP